MTLHLRANAGDYAPTTLLVGDPGRAEMIKAQLKDARRVSTNRGLLGYTGRYKDKGVSVQTTGMGCPSAAIVMEELLQLNVKRFIRIGTCGGIGKNIKPLDIIAAVAAVPYDGTTRTYLRGEPHAPFASFEILKTSFDIAQKMGVAVHYSGVASVDVFYNPFPDYVDKLRGQGLAAVEMETSLIYYLANRSGTQAASFLLVSDIVGGGEEFTKFVTDEALQKSMGTLVEYILEVVAYL